MKTSTGFSVLSYDCFLVLLQLDGSGANVSLVRHSEEIRAVVVGDLTAFTLYSVTVTAFTGSVSSAHGDGKASQPVLIRTLEDGEETSTCSCLIFIKQIFHKQRLIVFVFSQSPKIHLKM